MQLELKNLQMLRPGKTKDGKQKAAVCRFSLILFDSRGEVILGQNGLRFHYEDPEQPIYDCVMAKRGGGYYVVGYTGSIAKQPVRAALNQMIETGRARLASKAARYGRKLTKDEERDEWKDMRAILVPHQPAND